MVLLRRIEIHGHRLVSKIKLRRETKDWFARRNFFVRTVDIGVFAEIASVGLSDDKVMALEF